MSDTKHSVNKLISDFVGKKSGQGAADFLREIREVPEEGRIELASAIARQKNIPADDLAFTPVNY
jgi:hypothetical protein